MINVSLIKGYILHRLKSKTRHGIHSPFVYRLIDEVIYDFHAKKVYKEIENLRDELLSDERVISITDLGAGSYISNNKQKPVKLLAKNALKSPRLAQLIGRLAAFFKPENIIELGTCLGVTTAYLAKLSPESRIITVEGCPQTANIAQENLEKLAINNAKVIIGNFDKLLPGIIEKEQKLDFIFIDGNHRKEATLNYFKWCMPKIHEGSVIIFDDIYWSKGMKEAWEEIKSHSQVTLTIDLFWIGLVFFRKGRTKEEFKIRF